MKLIKVLLLTFYLLALVPQPALAQESSTTGRIRRSNAAIPNSYIVIFKDSVPQGRVKGFAAQLARTHGGTIGFTYEHALRGFSVELSEAQALALSLNPQVAYVEEDTLVEGASVQSNPTWALDRIDQRNLPLNASYNYADSGAGVNVYVVDGGIRYTHQEFGGRAVFAYDNVGDGRAGADCYGHGTHVAGIIGGNTYGVAKGVKLHSVRVLNCSNQALTSAVVAGMDWVTANHVKPAVANLSFFTGVANATMDQAVRGMIAAGVTSVAAAGNNTGDASLRSPARVTEAITVGAIDQDDNRASFSNFGSVIDVFAPGVSIASAHSTSDTATFNRFGTSQAAAFVAGLAARYLGKRPGDRPDAVSQAIRNSATPGKVINPGEGSPNLLAYALMTLSDGFNDNTRDTDKWLAPTATDITVTEENWRLEITPAATAVGYEGYKSATTVDLTDARVSVIVNNYQRINGFGSNFILSHSPGNNLMFGINGSNLVVQQEVGGVATSRLIPFDPGQHHIWRIRHNRADDTINWEVSQNGVTWTVLRSSPRPFSITDLQTILTAGKESATTPTTTATFDNLWHEPNPTLPVVMGDNFNDNVINPAMWVTSDVNASTTIKEQNGKLEVTLPPNTAGYNSMGLPSPFDFRGKTMQVEVQPASMEGWLQTHFQLYFDDNNYYIIQASNHAVACDAYVNGVLDRTAFSWDGASRFWRYRHDAEANTVSCETSTDGTAWTTRKTVAASFSLSAVKAVIGAGAWGTGNGAPGTASFDNFRVERSRSLFPQSDNFNDNTRDVKKWNAPTAPDFTAVEQNGQLHITPPASTTGVDGYYSTTNIDLTDASVAVEVVQPAGLSGPGVETVFQLVDPATGYYMKIRVNGYHAYLSAESSTSEYHAISSGTYDPAKHRFWRFRHNRTASLLWCEFSADGQTWVRAGADVEARDTPLTNWQIQLHVNKFTATAAATTTIFDNLRIERNEADSRIAEIEAWQSAGTTPERLNYALASSGAAALASSTYSSVYPVSAVNDGDRLGLNWEAGGGWNDATFGQYPDWVEVRLGTARTLTEVDLFTLQDNYKSPSAPTEEMTFSQYGVTDFEVQYWDGAAWQTISGASAAGNNKVWRKFTFSPITTDRIRVMVTGALASYSRITEVEAYH
jgi:hypothetical protein